MRHANCNADGDAYSHSYSLTNGLADNNAYGDSDTYADSNSHSHSYSYGYTYCSRYSYSNAYSITNSDVRPVHDQSDRRQYRAWHNGQRQSRG